jgi:hypothetical protein
MESSHVASFVVKRQYARRSALRLLRRAVGVLAAFRLALRGSGRINDLHAPSCLLPAKPVRTLVLRAAGVRKLPLDDACEDLARPWARFRRVKCFDDFASLEDVSQW